MKDFVLDWGFKKAQETDEGIYIEGYASTWEEDRDGEIVDRKSAIEKFKEFFSKNPIILYEHGKDPDVARKALGNVISYKIDEIGVWVKAFIPKPVLPLMQELYQKIKNGILKAFSISGAWANQGKKIIIKDLYELTICAVPTNPSSLFEVAVKSFGLKAQWTTAFINDLPNSSFAVIEPAYLKGDTDDKRARHLPFKDENGEVDLPHYRNALARVSLIEPITDSITTEDLRKKANAELDKYRDLLKEKSILQETIAARQLETELNEASWDVQHAFDNLFFKLKEDETLDAKQKLEKLSILLDEYKTLLLASFQTTLELGKNCASGDIREKAGRMISQANIDRLTALLEEMQVAMTRATALIERAQNTELPARTTSRVQTLT